MEEQKKDRNAAEESAGMKTCCCGAEAEYEAGFADLMNCEDAPADEKAPCCSGHTKKRTPEELKCLMNRLKRIEGQVRGLQRMLENEAYCPDVLMQSAAVTAAMNGFNKELLAGHIRTCVAEGIRQGKDEVIDELVATIEKLMR